MIITNIRLVSMTKTVDTNVITKCQWEGDFEYSDLSKIRILYIDQTLMVDIVEKTSHGPKILNIHNQKVGEYTKKFIKNTAKKYPTGYDYRLLKHLITGYLQLRFVVPEKDTHDLIVQADKELDEKFGKHKWHCDDIYDKDPNINIHVKNYLTYARAPGHGYGLDSVSLYADYKGNRVRVVVASRLGDVGVTYDLTKEQGYHRRVYLPELSNFSDKP